MEATEIFERNYDSTAKIVINRGGTRSSKTWSLNQLCALWLISGNYGSTGRLKISENKINYIAGQDARMELHYCLEDYLKN